MAPPCDVPVGVITGADVLKLLKHGEFIESRRLLQGRGEKDPNSRNAGSSPLGGVSTTESGFDMDDGLTLKPLSQCTGRSQGQWVCHPGLQLHQVRTHDESVKGFCFTNERFVGLVQVEYAGSKIDLG